ncbi:sulfite reductase subunit alpha [Roseomonas sp. CAU 1739]|uniref:sulfite reductase subunit alpha n=1 Tax=Roseomonas sp. CAU 1739 TaxID=3140364 RepID=UPI00325B3E11
MSPESGRLLAALAVLAAYAALCGLIAWRAARRRRPAAPAAVAAGAPPILVAYASQTGFAEELAQRTAAVLRAGAVPVRVSGVDGLDADALASARRALFLISTTGEGDAPDSAARFVRRVMGGPAALSGLDYGLLALGDSDYARYCDFGRRLDAWLQAQGATPLFDRIEVDGGAVEALDHWQAQVEGLAGTTPASTILALAEDFAPWRLVERCVLNPDGLGAPVFRLAFEPLAGQPCWQAGDIAVLAPCNPPRAVQGLLAALGLGGGGSPALSEALATRRLPADASGLTGLAPAALLARLPPLPRRDYSIASIPEAGRLELLVRQVRGADGEIGLGSGWLTAHVPIGGEVTLRLRPNPAFRAPDQDVPMILIGNGTGIAGLRAHLQARRRAGRRRNWLLFGERSSARDFLCGEEIEGWLAAGDLARLDLAFSRDGPGRYVQDALRAAEPALRRWIADGAVILVCGSLQGMAPGMHAVLQEALGVEGLEALAAEGRYRRDVY